MNEDQRTQIETQKTEYYEDEIELIDILRVIWKWKYIILLGTVLCGLIAAIISFNMSKVYNIDMVLRPGIITMEPQGTNVYIDSPENIKALIDSGTFTKNILNYLYGLKIKNIPKKLEFKVTVPKNSDTIKIEYKTSDIKQGVAIQEFLGKSLIETYSKRVSYYINESDMKLNMKKMEIDYIRKSIQSYKRNLKNIEIRIDELTSEIKLLKNNTVNLIKERDKLISDNPEDKDTLAALIYTNIIQQNLQLSNNYQNEINNYKQKKENELQNIEKSENEIDKQSNELKRLQLKKDNIQNIQILQTPTQSSSPVRPKKKLNVFLASVAGLFIMLFLAFFLEYLRKFKKSN